MARSRVSQHLACLGMCRPNIWPEKHLPQLRLVFQALGQLMAVVGERIAALCNMYMAQKVTCPAKLLVLLL